MNEKQAERLCEALERIGTHLQLIADVLVGDCPDTPVDRIADRIGEIEEVILYGM